MMTDFKIIHRKLLSNSSYTSDIELSIVLEKLMGKRDKP